MIDILDSVCGILWGVPVLLLILLLGIYLSFSTGMFQLRVLPAALKCLWDSIRNSKNEGDGTTPYAALCTALGATVGTGNLAGVAGAIALGGPGVLFWMWISGALGMIVKFAEIVLAIRYRVKDIDGNWLGGPMYYICNGLQKRMHWLAYLYCFFCAAAVFGVGNTAQANTLMHSTQIVLENYGVYPDQFYFVLLGFTLCVVVFWCFRRGSGMISNLLERIVPFAAGIYIILSLFVLSIRIEMLPTALNTIVIGAFCPRAVTGGFIASAFTALRVGTSRGVFTNEAGMGTASIAHAAASTNGPIKQGLLGITEVFVDTIVICTLTGLVILCSGIPIQYGVDTGIQLTLDAFSSVCGKWSVCVISVITALLALATILGWGLYGARCAQFLFGNRVWRICPYLQGAAVLLGVLLDTSSVWVLSELFNGLMAIPNIFAILCLSPVVKKTISAYRH